MTYAPDHRPYYDADSHVMEFPDFIRNYADPKYRDLIPPVNYDASLVTDEEVAEIVANGNQHTPEHIAAQIALGDKLIAESKEIQALGAFNSEDRSVALDMLGFKRQLVFATHSVVLPFHPSQSKIEADLRYAATRAHNRAMAEFCQSDSRLMGVAVIPHHVPAMALKELEQVISSGLKAVWIPHYAAGDMSPGHVELDPFWRRLAETGIPFVMHVGGSPLQLDKRWNNNGKAPSRDWMGGGENVRAKDMAVLHQGPETFLSMMVLDGVFERHPQLRGASVELGAGWVPSMLDRLDSVVKIWRRVDKNLENIKRTPTEQLSTQMGFTPFVYEHVGALVDQSNPDLYLFSSDYPHVEGGRDPIGRFESYLGDCEDSIRDKFYADNFLRLFPDAA